MDERNTRYDREIVRIIEGERIIEICQIGSRRDTCLRCIVKTGHLSRYACIHSVKQLRNFLAAAVPLTIRFILMNW